MARGELDTVKLYLEQGVDINTATWDSVENIFHILFKGNCSKRNSRFLEIPN
jgi:hypothetical protein